MNPYDPPETEAPEKPKTHIRPTDGIWLHPLEKLVAIASGLMVLLAILGALIVAWRTWG